MIDKYTLDSLSLTDNFTVNSALKSIKPEVINELLQSQNHSDYYSDTQSDTNLPPLIIIPEQARPKNKSIDTDKQTSATSLSNVEDNYKETIDEKELRLNIFGRIKSNEMLKLKDKTYHKTSHNNNNNQLSSINNNNQTQIQNKILNKQVNFNSNDEKVIIMNDDLMSQSQSTLNNTIDTTHTDTHTDVHTDVSTPEKNNDDMM